LFLYFVFDTAHQPVIDRYGGYVSVSTDDVERASGWFRRWGESSVFWGRLLPVLRSIISIPAGIAGMGVGKFTVYSAGGSGLFATGVAGLVLTGREVLPSQVLFAWLTTGFRRATAMALSNPVFATAALGLALFVALLVRNVVAKYIDSLTGG
jgi:membrane protein DedA with SNARE-associated domain